MTLNRQKIIFSISFLLGCIVLGVFVYASQVSKQRSIEKQQAVKLAEEKKAEYFKRKVECEKYSTEIKRELEPNDQSSFNFSIGTEIFNFIFYSPKVNSCLYSILIITDNGKRGYIIYNALTKSKVASFQLPEQLDDYEKFILEYSEGEIRL